MIDKVQKEPVSTKDKLLALSDGRLHLGWIDDAKVVEFEECLMQFHEDMNNIPQGTDSLTRLKDTDGVLHSYSKKLMSMAKEEPVSEDLREAARKYFKSLKDDCFISSDIMLAFKAGAKWQKQKDESCSKDLGEYINELSKQFPEVSFAKLSRIAVRVVKWQKENLWKPADGDDLPEIDREVIALLNNGKVVFAHRPYKGKYIGKNLTTGNIETFENKTYDEGGWNIPNVKWWLDCSMPKEIEL